MHYYTYAYLREDKTPYYIGKGTGDRLYKKGSRVFAPPKDKSRIIYLKQNLTEAEAFKHEIYMIDVLGRKDLGTGILRNRTNGGEGPSGWVPSEETRRKMSESSKNPSEETRRKISEAQKGHTVSEESKKKMSEAQKGKTTSEETRKRMSEAKKGENNHNYGKTASEETRRKISEAKKGENHHMYGKTHSEETRRKISELKKGRKWWNDGCGNCKFVVECPGDGWKLGRK